MGLHGAGSENSTASSGGGFNGFVNLFRGHAGAATIAGTLEIAVFHPFDTAAKRLMSSESSVMAGGVSKLPSNLNKIIFKKHADSSFAQKFAYMYPGSLYAMWYKVLQRVYKFAGQPIVRDGITRNFGQSFDNAFGKKSKMMTESVAGSLIGIGEVILLPLDRLKVLAQTNEAALGGRSAIRVLLSEGRGMYAGTVVTMTRNAPGSFALFGGTAFTKEVIFGLEDYRKATFLQNSIASLVGSCLSIAITQPADLLKTRVQNKAFGTSVSAASIFAEVLRQEGVTAFFKGLTPKIIASAPKLVFAYTLTEYFAKLLSAGAKPTGATGGAKGH